MKTIVIVIVAALFIASVAEGIFLGVTLMNNSKLSAELSTVKQSAGNLEKEKADLLKIKTDLESNKNDLTINIGKLTQEKESLQGQVDKFVTDGKTLEGKISELNVSLSKKDDRINKLVSESDSLKTKFLCSKQITNADFTSNNSVDKSIVQYVNDTKGESAPVSAHYWNQIWTGENYSIHTVEVSSPSENTTYVWKFTVYFRGEANGDHVNGIFYNDRQCWLYLDK